MSCMLDVALRVCCSVSRCLTDQSPETDHQDVKLKSELHGNRCAKMIKKVSDENT